MPKINFDKLTRMEQRVVIAEDLIKRLKTRSFRASRGTYLRPQKATFFRGIDNLPPSTEVRDALKRKACKGCEIGGLFLCAVDRHNKLSLQDIRRIEDHDSAFRCYLQKWFSYSELTMLERAFEGWGKFGDWLDKHPRDSVRMTLIAKNIINNNGRFVVSQLLRA